MWERKPSLKGLFNDYIILQQKDDVIANWEEVLIQRGRFPQKTIERKRK